MKNIQRTLVLGASIVALAGCGADEITSPGTSGDIIINNPAPTPVPAPAPTPTPTVTAAAGCPTINATDGLMDMGVLSTPTGEYRVCQLPAVFDAETDTLRYVPGLLYSMSGRVSVGVDVGAANSFSGTQAIGGTDPLAGEDPQATLEIEPGVIIFAETGRTFFTVNRGSVMNADGTATNPIIWTSRDNVLGLNTDASTQQWGGVVFLGRAPVADCELGGAQNTAATPNANLQCQKTLEGTNETILYGGSFSDDSSGSMTFNQIRFSGFAIAPGNELQALTTGSVGSGTTFNNIQSFNSFDDGIEFFGGTVQMRNIAVVGAGDDSIDADYGTKGALQNVVVKQRTGAGDSIIENDSPDADGAVENLPQTQLAVTNFTFIQQEPGANQVVRARGGSQLLLSNGVIQANGRPCVRLDETVTVNANSTFNSIIGDCSTSLPLRATNDAGSTDAALTDQLEAIYLAADANNTIDTDVTFTNGFLFDAGAAPTFDATRVSSFFVAANYIGALENAADDRFVGWTCDSATLDFGTGSACTTLPLRPGEG